MPDLRPDFIVPVFSQPPEVTDEATLWPPPGSILAGYISVNRPVRGDIIVQLCSEIADELHGFRGIDVRSPYSDRRKSAVHLGDKFEFPIYNETGEIDEEQIIRDVWSKIPSLRKSKVVTFDTAGKSSAGSENYVMVQLCSEDGENVRSQRAALLQYVGKKPYTDESGNLATRVPDLTMVYVPARANTDNLALNAALEAVTRRLPFSALLAHANVRVTGAPPTS